MVTAFKKKTAEDEPDVNGFSRGKQQKRSLMVTAFWKIQQKRSLIVTAFIKKTAEEGA